MKKYELTEETIVDYGKTLHRVRYLHDFPQQAIKKGDLGGYVQSEDNLSQEGLCLVKDSAIVTGDALVSDDAIVSGNAWVGDNARVSEHAKISHSATVRGDSVIRGKAHIWGRATVAGTSIIEGGVSAYNDAHICHDQEPVSPHLAHLSGDVKVRDMAIISGQAVLKDAVTVCDEAKVTDRAVIKDASSISGSSVISGEARISGNSTIKKSSRVMGKAIVKDDSTISDAIISGHAIIDEKSKLIGNITVTGDALVQNSTIKGKVHLKDKSTVYMSRLVGDMTIRDAVVVSSSELNGKNIVLQGKCVVFMVVLKEGNDIEIRDKAKLRYLTIEKLVTAWIGETAIVSGHSEFKRSLLTSTNFTVGGNACLDAEFSITGENILIFDDAFVTGRVNIGSNVTLKEMASVVIGKPAPNFFQLENMNMSMDNAIVR